MRRAGNILRTWFVMTGVLGVMAFFMSLPVHADRMTSTNFVLNGNESSSFGGQGTSTNYGMFSTGGEPVIGRGTSGSYILGGGFTAQQERSIQVTVQPSGLLGFWNFNESTGTLFADSSATRADATASGSGLSSASGKIGNGLQYTVNSPTTDNTRILIPAQSIQPSSITLSLWFNASSFPNEWNSLCSYYSSPSEDWGPFELYTDGDHGGNAFSWNVHNNVRREVITSPTTYSAGTWYHIVGTYDAATGFMALYVNGALVNSQTYPAGPINYTVANPDNQISCFNNGRWSSEGAPGTIDHLKIFNRALSAGEIKAEYDAQNAGVVTGLTLGSVTPGTSNTVLQDVTVRTDSGAYGVSVSQNHDLQKGATTIPAMSGGTIASPATWSEGTTKGLGFTLISAPGLDSKWSSGTKYAAIPGSATSFYTRSGHASSDTIDVINSRLRLDTTTSQETGTYSNTVTYTGTVLP